MDKPMPRENEGKNIAITCDEKSYHRIPLKTKLITKDDDIAEVAKEFASPYLKEGDILEAFVMEEIER